MELLKVVKKLQKVAKKLQQIATKWQSKGAENPRWLLRGALFQYPELVKGNGVSKALLVPRAGDCAFFQAFSV